MPTWSPFGGKLSVAPAPFDPRWSQLARVQHVTHVALARRIVEEGRISPGLVGEGILAATRERVTWVSPNTWEPGPRYGSVEFAFEWLPLVGARRLMWVEPIKYGLQTVRLLLTDRPAHWLPFGVLAYDPTTDDGPIQLLAGSWYKRHDIVVEVMIDGDISLAQCLELGFVNHHPRYCSLGLSNCAEAGATLRAKSQIFGYIIGAGLHGADHALVSGDKPIGGLNPGYSDLWFSLRFSQCKGPIATLEEAKILARAAALLAGVGQLDAAKRAFHLIANQALALDAMNDVIRDHFDRPGLELD